MRLNIAHMYHIDIDYLLGAIVGIAWGAAKLYKYTGLAFF